MNLKQYNAIGQGAMFPIELSTPKDADGKDEYIEVVTNGVTQKVKKIGWYPRTGLGIVKHNITSTFVYQIGERFRHENFGSRLWECIEEPNTDLLAYMATKFIKESLLLWEPRVRGLDVNCLREGSKLYIQIQFSIGTDSVEEAIIEYDKSTNSTYAY